MLDLVGNHIVGFPTRRLNYRLIMWYNMNIMSFEVKALDIFKDKLVFKMLNIEILPYFLNIFVPSRNVSV